MNPNNYSIRINLNSIKVLLQCLSNCEDLTTYIINNNDHQTYEDIFPITSEYSKIIKNLFYNKNTFNIKAVSITQNFKDLIIKNNISSLEPKTIYNFILEKIHEENKNPIENQNYQNQMNTGIRSKDFINFKNQKFIPEDTSYISKNFFGIEEIKKTCSNCQNCVFNYEIFKYIEFDIKEVNNSFIEKINNLLKNKMNKSFNRIMNNNKEKRIELMDCFDSYINYIKDQKTFICNKCSYENKESYQKHKIMKLPNVLCIIIKREEDFNFNVSYPETLNIGKYIEYFVVNKIYNLIGVILYTKQKYIAKFKSLIDKQWYLYDNDKIVKSDFSNFEKEAFSYMLFYQKINI